VKVFFQDEGIFGRMSNPVRCWAPPGVRPRVAAQRIREYLYAYSAVCPQDGALFSLILPQANAATAEIFFNEFSKAHASYRVVMVMDQASWHPREGDERWENIRFIHQPAHSPELNPAEHLWEHMRENYFHNQAFSSLDALEEELVRALQEMENDKPTIQSLTGFHWTIFDV
jgi:putative transposase